MNAHDMPLAGEIISYEIPSGTRISHDDLKLALKAAGFDQGLARDMQPRNAFARAAGELAEQRLIRKLEDSTGFLKFQFTREAAEGSGDQKRLAYNFEAILTLNKRTGEVFCDESPELAAEAGRLIQQEMGTRKTGDISRIMFALFDTVDVFPVRSQGGCYFVPGTFSDFLTNVEGLLDAIGQGCAIRRFPVLHGYGKSTERSIKESINLGLDRLIAAHLSAISEFEVSTRAGTMERMADAVKTTRFKIEAYADFLGERAEELRQKVEDAKKVLRAKVMEVSGTDQAIAGHLPADEPAVLNAA